MTLFIAVKKQMYNATFIHVLIKVIKSKVFISIVVVSSVTKVNIFIVLATK
jgi:hypothetical protein